MAPETSLVHRRRKKKRSLEPMMSSENANWGTPKDFFLWLDAAFSFTVDVCADRKNAKCRRYYDVADDGLSQSWARERFYMNPEYGDQLPRWMRKARLEVTNRGAAGMCLVPSRIETDWYRQAIAPSGPLKTSYYVPDTRMWWCKWAGIIIGQYHHDCRLSFEGMPGTNAPFPSTVLIVAPVGFAVPPIKTKHSCLDGRLPLTMGMPR